MHLQHGASVVQGGSDIDDNSSLILGGQRKQIVTQERHDQTDGNTGMA